MLAHFAPRITILAFSLSRSMKDIVNLLAGDATDRHQLIDAGLRFGAP